ncbi:MAG: hypothetical protein HY308_01635 [Gammaproteobacteria bacterium]|nr:hypothetical protein [Gammaproteobacteria bacterium]
MTLTNEVVGIGISLLCATHFALADSNGNGDEAGNGRFSFALWGDLPYAKSNDETKIAALVASMNAQHLAFTAFDGDTKDGSSLCTDDAIGAQASARLDQLAAPTIYVPSDNEWTDCHRINNGGYNALERLSYIRANLFNSPTSFGQKKITLDHQGPLGGAYSENTRWIRANIVFVGLNVPGSNNNKVNDGACVSSKSVRTQADCDADNAEYAERNARNIAWLQEAFAIAKQRHSPGLMIVMQADPGFDLPETEAVNERNSAEVNGYTDFLNAVIAQTQSFDGQVVLAHGDTHFFKIDKPLIQQAELVKNFTRVETFGSPNAHWVKVTVAPKSRNVFHFEPVIVPEN